MKQQLSRSLRALFVVLGLFSFAAARAEKPVYPLKIGSDHRFLVDQANVPFLIQGDAAWSLIVQLKDSDVDQYLKGRQSLGFNSIIVNLIEHQFCTHPPNNAYGEAPFTTPGDFTTPNEKYFAHADWVIREAAKYGVQVFLAPIYLGYKGTSEGWIKETLANGPEKCLEYGRYLGKRYKNFNNIVWLIGGDRDPGPALEDVDMVALGIKEYDKRHLFTAHCAPEHMAVRDYSGAGWLNINTVYTYKLVHDSLIRAYNRAPLMPYFLIESTYEGEHNADPVQIRRQAYWADISGSTGQFIGNRPIWLFDHGWQSALHSTGSQDMGYLNTLFHSLPWYKLIPDQRHRVVTEGVGEFNGLNYLAAARTADGSTVIAYMPTRRTVTVDMSKISGAQAQAWWFNPRTGAATLIGEFATSGSREFTPASAGDWVLLLEDASKNLPRPGSVKITP